MKQLLHCCDQVALVALNERAFLVFADSDGDAISKNIVELLPEPPSPPPPAPPAAKKKLDPSTTTDAPAEAPAAADDKKSDPSATAAADDKKPDPATTTTSLSGENPIQAVAIEIEKVDGKDSVAWCAVSTLNKTLAIYRIDLSEADNSNITGVRSESSHMVHKLKKRVGCMSFARIPEEGATAATDANGKLVVLTGDLVGDAWAFNVTGSKPETRFVMGHTASMLTGIQVKQQTLFTSDRDEKIRVSQFPQAVIVKGFLLGHEAYVSSIDVAGVAPICVSCSGGDGTVRLWDYEKMIPLSIWSSNDEPAEDSDGENDDDDDAMPKIPARVSIDNEANFVTVIHDQCNTVHILRVVRAKADSEETTSLELFQTIVCPDQAVAVTFTKDAKLLVALKHPSYSQAYALVKGDVDGLFEAIDLPGLVALQKIGAESSIIMPESALEKDKQGIPTLHKIVERRTKVPADKHEWNDSSRIAIAKERRKRHRKKRKLAGKS